MFRNATIYLSEIIVVCKKINVPMKYIGYFGKPLSFLSFIILGIQTVHFCLISRNWGVFKTLAKKGFNHIKPLIIRDKSLDITILYMMHKKIF